MSGASTPCLTGVYRNCFNFYLFTGRSAVAVRTLCTIDVMNNFEKQAVLMPGSDRRNFLLVNFAR